jgi:uncharacterized membrane protein YuzA (DUF378 family)
MKMGTMGWIAWVLVIVGGLNWGLVGFFQYDLVASLLGGTDAMAARVVYALVGLSAVYVAFMPKDEK